MPFGCIASSMPRVGPPDHTAYSAKPACSTARLRSCLPHPENHGGPHTPAGRFSGSRSTGCGVVRAFHDDKA